MMEEASKHLNPTTTTSKLWHRQKQASFLDILRYHGLGLRQHPKADPKNPAERNPEDERYADYSPYPSGNDGDDEGEPDGYKLDDSSSSESNSSDGSNSNGGGGGGGEGGSEGKGGSGGEGK